MEDWYTSDASCECHDSLSADEERTSKKRKILASIKKWIERNTTLLIDLLEERYLLWDKLDSEYMKREVREVVYKEIAERFVRQKAKLTIYEPNSEENSKRQKVGNPETKCTVPLGLIGMGCSFLCHK